MYLLQFYVPESHLEAVKNAVFNTGAGHVGNYERCCWQTLGEGQFKPLEGAVPYSGKIDNIEKCAEYKVEIVVPKELINDAVQALLKSHPYETPAYQVLLCQKP